MYAYHQQKCLCFSTEGSQPVVKKKNKKAKKKKTKDTVEEIDKDKQEKQGCDRSEGGVDNTSPNKSYNPDFHRAKCEILDYNNLEKICHEQLLLDVLVYTEFIIV